MKIEDAIEVVLETVLTYGSRSVEDCDEIFEAAHVVEDFFVNNVFKDEEHNPKEDK